MKKEIIKVLTLLFVFLMIVSLFGILSWYIENKNNHKVVKKETVNIKEKDDNYYLDKNIFKDNKYTVGWLIVEGTDINYPVVKYKDNSYYLNHDFYNNINSSGWVFMDYKNKLDDMNLVIYGHHRRDGSMFGSIDKLFKNKSNYEILFITTEGTTKYQIFSVYSIDKNDNYNLNNYDEFDKYIKKIKNRSEIEFDEKIKNVEQIITLSTCNSNNKERLVVHGYKKS